MSGFGMLWLAFALIVGVAASKRYGRSGGVWFVISLLISPLLGFLLLAALGPKRQPQHEPYWVSDRRPEPAKRGLRYDLTHLW